MADTEFSSSLRHTDVNFLIQLVRAGDTDAFSELITRYQIRVFRTAYSILKNSEDAEDAMQETYLRVFNKIHTFEGTSAFSTWLTRIVINTCLMRLRQKRTRPTMSFDELNDGDGSSFLPLAAVGPNPEQAFLSADLKQRLHKAVHRLPASLREVAQDQIYGELLMQQVADKRGLSVAAAKSRAYRARKMLVVSLNRPRHTLQGDERNNVRLAPGRSL